MYFVDVNQKPDLSIIVPLYNEEESVRTLYKKIIAAIDSLPLRYEIVFVDDGSVDATFVRTKEIAEEDRNVKVIKFKKNYGQTPAMVAGIEYARGSILTTMDGDLQNDPTDIPQFLEKIHEGYDIVVGWRHQRQDSLFTRKIPSALANWLIGKVTGVPIKDNGCSLKAYRADIIKSVPLYSEMHRFIPAMASITGASIAEIKVRHHPRRYGVSKYGLSRIYRVLLDLLTVKTLVSFATRPLLWFSILAFPFALVSGLALFFSIYEVVVQSSSLPIPIAGVGVLFGALVVILFLGGVLAELVYKSGDARLNKLAFLTTARLSPDTEESPKVLITPKPKDE
jgi:glycosyltransferase involved in cell wall biosynthesis